MSAPREAAEVVLGGVTALAGVALASRLGTGERATAPDGGVDGHAGAGGGPETVTVDLGGQHGATLTMRPQIASAHSGCIERETACNGTGCPIARPEMYR